MGRSVPAQVTLFAGFIGGLLALHLTWLPRIVGRRLAAEMLEDPVGAARRHRTARWLSVLGFTLGTVFGGAGVVVGLYLATQR